MVPSLDNFPGFKVFSFDEFTLVARRVEIHMLNNALFV